MYTHIPIQSILKSYSIFMGRASPPPPNREERLAHEMLMLVWNGGISSIKRDPFNTPAKHALYLFVKWWKKVTKESHLYLSPLELEKKTTTFEHTLQDNVINVAKHSLQLVSMNEIFMLPLIYHNGVLWHCWGYTQSNCTHTWRSQLLSLQIVWVLCVPCCWKILDFDTHTKHMFR